jgi:hypothetical protein
MPGAINEIGNSHIIQFQFTKLMAARLAGAKTADRGAGRVADGS